MRKILFTFGGVNFYSYPVMLYLGALIGTLAGGEFASGNGLDPVRTYAALITLFPAALVGARLLFILAHWRFYRCEPRRFWRRSEGGASLYGGLILSVLVSFPLLKILMLRFGAFWDTASVTLLVGMMFTKVGCLLNGCCAGRPTTGRLGLYLPDIQGVWCRRVPAQLLEAGLAAFIFLGILILWKQFPFEGARFLGALAVYAAGRWWLESIRDDVETIGSFSLHQTISVALLILCFLGFGFIWTSKP